MTTERIYRQPSLEIIIGKWVVIAGAFGLALQLAWCLRENLSDELYYARHYVLDQADKLVGAYSRNGQFETADGRSLAHYGGAGAAAYGFRIVDGNGRTVAERNSARIEAVSPISAVTATRPDFWLQKIGAEWFEIAGGVKSKVGNNHVWVEIMTLGDPHDHRLSALVGEIITDVWTPLAPTFLLTLALAIVAVRKALMPLNIAAGRASALDIREGALSIEITELPREAAYFASAMNSLIERIQSLLHAQERVVARVAHELRTGLGIVLLELNKVADDRARRLEGDIDDMSDAVERLLTMARMRSADTANWTPVPISLEAIVGKVIARVTTFAELRSSQLSTVIDRPEPIMGDPASVFEAIWNVVENALKHGHEGNHVRVACGPGCVVTVDDSGPGLATDDIERLFEPFERGSTEAEGVGLGLAIVKAAVDLHRGSIDVSRSPFGGARFTLRFGSIECLDEFSRTADQ
jgi:signal transduction histidine kinase